MSCPSGKILPVPPAPSDPAGILGASHLFLNTSASLLEDLRQQARLIECKKGHVLFMQDDIAEWFYVIGSGWIKLFRETLDGTEVIVDVLNHGGMFGETALFNDNLYPFSAEVVETSTLLACPAHLLRDALEEDQALALGMLRHISRTNALREREIEHRTAQNAPQRIGCFFLQLALNKGPGPITLHLPYDKTIIAARLGMQPETFSRALTRLQSDVGVRVRGPVVEIPNLDILTSYTCSACSNVFPCKD